MQMLRMYNTHSQDSLSFSECKHWEHTEISMWLWSEFRLHKVLQRFCACAMKTSRKPKAGFKGGKDFLLWFRASGIHGYGCTMWRSRVQRSKQVNWPTWGSERPGGVMSPHWGPQWQGVREAQEGGGQELALNTFPTWPLVLAECAQAGQLIKAPLTDGAAGPKETRSLPRQMLLKS